jgi:isatin hydrolase
MVAPKGAGSSPVGNPLLQQGVWLDLVGKLSCYAFFTMALHNSQMFHPRMLGIRRRSVVDPTLLNPARVIDLSVTLSEGLPGTWPGHMTFAHHNWNWFAEVEGPTGRTRSIGPYQTNFLVIDEHCGTHFDAPTHFVSSEGSGLPLAGPLGAETGDRVPAEDFMGQAVVVDMRSLSAEGKPGVSPFITGEHVRAWEGEHGPINEGEVVLFRTGWDRHYVEGEDGLR